jgi:hypothetical protein
MIFPIALTLEASSPRMTAPVVARQDVQDVEADALDKTARVANEVGRGAAPGLPSDPQQRANVARDFKLHINTEQRDVSSGSTPAPMPARSCCAMRVVGSWLMVFLLVNDRCRSVYL